MENKLMTNEITTNVGIIVVTYNRKECLKKCIDAIKKQTYSNYQIYVIDNASDDGTSDWCKECEGLHYIELTENQGGAYGFYYGIKSAVEDGCDFVWGMDDDAYPKPDALWKLLEVSRIYDMDTTAFYSDSVSHLSTYKKGMLQPVRSWTFVGFGISKKMIEKIGYPRSDLFIFYDDFEYSRRIVNSGYTIVKVHDSIIIHEGALKITNMDSFHRKKFLTKEIKVQILPKWKMYYLARNRILIENSLKPKLSAVYDDLKMAGKIIYVCPDMLHIWIKGFLDGIKGKTGKVVSPK